jgi:hypothetical protein
MIGPGLRRMLKDVTAPLVWRAATRLATRRPASAHAADLRPDHAPAPLALPDSGPKPLNYLIGSPVFVVPLARVRYPDGRAYTYGDHHFMQYYRSGLPALRRYYERHVPRNVFEQHFLPTPADGRAPPSGLPWFEEVPPMPVHGEAGLGPEHGDQAHGPVSEAKLHLEARRLDRVLASIQREGFRPELWGYPHGCFMLHTDGRWVFAIRSGFHRVAAMTHLGFPAISVTFSHDAARFVEASDVAVWPMVRDGRMTVEGATAIFSQYFLDGPLTAALGATE